MNPTPITGEAESRDSLREIHRQAAEFVARLANLCEAEQPEESEDASGSEDAGGSEGAGSAEDMPYPKEGQIFVPLNPTEDQPTHGLSDALNLWARDHGYSVVIGRSKKDGNRRRKMCIVCSKHGKPCYRVTATDDDMIRQAREQGRRKPMDQRRSLRTGCPFRFNLVEDGPGTNRFEVRYRQEGNPPHNHERIEGWAAHARSRILRPEQQERVDMQIIQGLPAGDIVKGLHIDGISHLATRDIHNRRQYIKTRGLGGLSPTNNLIRRLSEQKVPAFAESVNGQLTRLFVAPNSSLDLKGRALHLIMMDSTFGTNKHGLAMVHFVCKGLYSKLLIALS
jgi:hypothetical protein